MRLVFNEVTIIDFKAFRGSHKLRLDLPGVTYLFGDNKVTRSLAGNGAAKSTIWDALIWCLYGRTPLGLRNADVKPWAGGKTSVAVTVAVDNRRRVIKRETSPNRFTCDGEDIVDAKGIIGVSFELAINAILLPQDTELFLNRSPSDKMKLLTETLSLERWDTRSKAASTQASTWDADIALLERDVDSIEGSLLEVTRSITSTKLLATEWGGVSRNRERVSAKELTALRKRGEAVSKGLDAATLKEDGKLTELRALETGLAKKRREQQEQELKISRLDGHVKALSDDLAQLERDVETLSEARSCPTCGQTVKASTLAKHKDHLNARANVIDAEITSEREKRGQLIVARNKSRLEITRDEEFAEKFRVEARDASDKVLRLAPEAATIVRQLREAAVLEEVNPHIKSISELEARKKRLLQEKQETEQELEKTRAGAERIRFWVKGFKDIKLQLIEEVLGELEMAANSMIEEVGLEGWQIRFDVEKESKSGSIQNMINVEILSPESNKPVKWDSYSGGEKQRLRLVGSLALVDVLLAHAGVETNLEILDEPAIYWASEGVQELVSFLAYRAREREKSVFFIEHSAVESTHFARVWTVVKGKSGAKVTQ